jgi:RNA polymerase sigma-70 factor (ECF subfamily)
MEPADLALARAVREAGDRLRAALASRLRDFDLAEEALAQACAAALPAWRRDGPPKDPAAWLYASARRKALDHFRRATVRRAHREDERAAEPTPEDVVLAAFEPIPDDRLRMIFVCCHPALAVEARLALTLRTLCGLSTIQIAAAFLTSEAAIAQRLTRAKRKIREARIPFETPGPDQWPSRLNAVLAALEIAYAQAYERAELADRSELAAETRRLSALLAELMPAEPEVLGLGALISFAESRRRARLDGAGRLVPLDRQDPRLWDMAEIHRAADLLSRAAALGRTGPLQILASIHAAHASRLQTGVTPWNDILHLYDGLVRLRPGPVSEVHRALALMEAQGAAPAAAELRRLGHDGRLDDFLPWRLASAEAEARLGASEVAAMHLRAALERVDTPAERGHIQDWLVRIGPVGRGGRLSKPTAGRP